MVRNLLKKDSKESIVSLLNWLYKYISRKNKIKLLKLLILMLICGFSEVIAISSVIPFLNMLSFESETLCAYYADKKVNLLVSVTAGQHGDELLLP